MKSLYVIPFGIQTNKYSGSSKNVNNPNEKLFLPDIIKKLNDKVFKN